MKSLATIGPRSSSVVDFVVGDFICPHEWGPSVRLFQTVTFDGHPILICDTWSGNNRLSAIASWVNCWERSNGRSTVYRSDETGCANMRFIRCKRWSNLQKCLFLLTVRNNSDLYYPASFLHFLNIIAFLRPYNMLNVLTALGYWLKDILMNYGLRTRRGACLFVTMRSVDVLRFQPVSVMRSFSSAIVLVTLEKEWLLLTPAQNVVSYCSGMRIWKSESRQPTLTSRPETMCINPSYFQASFCWRLAGPMNDSEDVPSIAVSCVPISL